MAISKSPTNPSSATSQEDFYQWPFTNVSYLLTGANKKRAEAIDEAANFIHGSLESGLHSRPLIQKFLGILDNYQQDAISGALSRALGQIDFSDTRTSHDKPLEIISELHRMGAKISQDSVVSMMERLVSDLQDEDYSVKNKEEYTKNFITTMERIEHLYPHIWKAQTIRTPVESSFISKKIVESTPFLRLQKKHPPYTESLLDMAGRTPLGGVYDFLLSKGCVHSQLNTSTELHSEHWWVQLLQSRSFWLGSEKEQSTLINQRILPLARQGAAVPNIMVWDDETKTIDNKKVSSLRVFSIGFWSRGVLEVEVCRSGLATNVSFGSSDEYKAVMRRLSFANKLLEVLPEQSLPAFNSTDKRHFTTFFQNIDDNDYLSKKEWDGFFTEFSKFCLQLACKKGFDGSVLKSLAKISGRFAMRHCNIPDDLNKLSAECEAAVLNAAINTVLTTKSPLQVKNKKTVRL